MPPLNLLIKPASSNCNLKCSYCFYHSLSEQRTTKSFGLMELETLEVIVKKALLYADESCTFAFQGGEPTLTGISFYKKALEYQKEHNVKKISIFNTIQTNGMLINDEWAKFLAENNFLVGISIDGPKEINDINRISPNGEGTFKKILASLELFKKFGVEFNVLFVVNSNVARHVTKTYNFLKKNNFDYIQFIPCIDPLDEQSGGYRYSLMPKVYSDFLKKLFDLWFDDVIKGKKISIRYFDNIINMLRGYYPESCGITGVCQNQLVIEADGGVYPCDFYVVDQWFNGNIRELSFEELLISETSLDFIESSKNIDPQCVSCHWYNLCRSGCRRNREPIDHNTPSLNYFCSSYIEFFEYSFERLFTLAKLHYNR